MPFFHDIQLSTLFKFNKNNLLWKSKTRVTSYESKSTSYEFKPTSYELKFTS